MKSLFGGGLLDSTGPSPLSDATHKAKTTTLPASAAAAIAAAQAAAGGRNPSNTTLDPKTVSVEWDFGDGDEDPTGAAGAPSPPGALECGSPSQGVQQGGVGGRVSPGGAVSPPSPGAVTPQARGGSGGMWADAVAEEEREALREPPPLAERQRRYAAPGVGVGMGWGWGACVVLRLDRDLGFRGPSYCLVFGAPLFSGSSLGFCLSHWSGDQRTDSSSAFVFLRSSLCYIP